MGPRNQKTCPCGVRAVVTEIPQNQPRGWCEDKESHKWGDSGGSSWKGTEEMLAEAALSNFSELSQQKLYCAVQ